MKTLKQGCTGSDVKRIQRILYECGYFLKVDGIFGPRTQEAVREFQECVDIKPDGIVGKMTWYALEGIHDFFLMDMLVTGSIFEKAARTLFIDLAAIRAVHQVETGCSSGFLRDGRPVILFEGHIFWSQLKKSGLDPGKYRTGNEDILFPAWDPKSYQGGTEEYDRLHRACLINHEAALMSASWGMFQIMGLDYELCGYDSVFKYAASMFLSQEEQMGAFVSFLQSTGLDVALRGLDWAEFARGYNGPKYKENRYDERLEAAYLQFSKK